MPAADNRLALHSVMTSPPGTRFDTPESPMTYPPQGPYGQDPFPPPPPGNYGPPPGYGPPWQSVPGQPRRRGGSFVTAMTIVFGILTALALFLSLMIGHDASTCNSGIGEFAQALDQQAASQCSTVNTAHAALEVVTVVLGLACIGFLAATIDRVRR